MQRTTSSQSSWAIYCGQVNERVTTNHFKFPYQATNHPSNFHSVSMVDTWFTSICIFSFLLALPYQLPNIMDDRLKVPAQTGDIDTLYTLLTLDPLLLENIDQFPFSQTPLHVAALSGQTSFLLELINLKPSLSRKLNTDGYSPIHIASIEGQVEMVRELLEFDQDLGLLRGKEWRTPLHCAVISGMVEVVNELLSACASEWLKALTVRKETVLHLALKYGQIEIFEILVERIKSMKVEEILNWKDREGNTILHVAADRKQFQIIYLLLKTDGPFKVMDKDVKNKNGMTALSVLKQHTVDETNKEEMENILRRFGAVVSLERFNPPRRVSSKNSMEPLIILEKLFQGLPMEKWANEIESSPIETRSALMVVAVLIATVTFQAVLTPPGGFTERFGRTRSALFENYPVFLITFSVMNSIGFMTSIAMLTVLTRGFPLKALMRMAVLPMVATYISFIAFLDLNSPVVTTVAALLMLTILLLQWIHFTIRSMKKVVYVKF